MRCGGRNGNSGCGSRQTTWPWPPCIRARPKPASFKLPDGSGEGIAYLLHFEDDLFSNIAARIFPLRDVLLKGVIPFAEALGGNVLCFNYRKDPGGPTVEFWSVDTGPVPMTSSFTDLLTKLHEQHPAVTPPASAPGPPGSPSRCPPLPAPPPSAAPRAPVAGGCAGC